MKTRLPNLPALAIALGFSVSAVWAADDAAETSRPATGNTAVAPVAYFNYIADEAAAPAAAEPVAPDMLPPVTKFSPERTKGGQSADGSCRSGRPCGRDSCSRDVPRGVGIFWDPWCSIEFVNAWTKERDLPPLVTTGGVDGVLGTGSTPLFGGEGVGGDRQNGGRLDFGAWFDQGRVLGFGANFFAIEGDKTDFSRASNAAGTPLLARPFFDSSVYNAQRSLIVTKTNVRSGSITAAAENELMSAEAYLRLLLHTENNRRLDLIGGYHFSRIDDSLRINHNMYQIAGVFPNPTGTTFAFEDNFAVTNEYQAGEVGLWGQYDFRRVTLSMLAKLSMGNMHREVEISGRSSKTLPNTPTANYNGGLLALGSNLGTWTEDKFVIAPEADIKLLFHINPRFDLSVGYSVLCWDAVALAGQQIDTSMANTPTVNSTQLLGGGPAVPDNPALPAIKDSRFWVQSLTLGGVFKF